MGKRSGLKKTLVAAVTSLAVLSGTTATANAVDTIGPATDFYNKFWGTYDALVGGGAGAAATPQDAQSKSDNAITDKEQSRLDATLGAVDQSDKSADAAEFASIRDTSQIGDYWSSLNALRVEDHPNLNKDDKETKKTYDRDKFEHWSLIGTQNTKDDWPEGIPASCDARRATLIRDGVNLKVKAKGCKISVGKNGGWVDSYGYPEKDGKEVKRDSDGNVVLKEYKQSNKPNGFDIDHIVALEDVWYTGGLKWNDEQREQIANDPLNLSISDSSANRSKSSQTPSSYLPLGRFKCEYAKRYVAVKKKYDLSVSAKDVDVLTQTGQFCKL